MSKHPLETILHPKSIAVVGASDKANTMGYSYVTHLLEYGYRGDIYPVNPKYTEIQGLKAYPNLREIPGFVDYVISCVPSHGVLDMLEDCAEKGVKGVHFYTARFSETGHQDAIRLEQEVLKKVRESGVRLIGPNCMGLYYPEEGISFAYDLPKEPGSLGLISQTGGGAATFVNMASMRGIRFSKVFSYGNGLDLNECDYLDYLTQDPETKVITMYIEGVKDGQRFQDSLHRATAKKPVIITKAGRGKAGVKAAASHTASLAGAAKTWKTVIVQAGAVYAKSLEEMTDYGVAFIFLPPIGGPRVGISGGGGGPSVLAADECEEEGLDVVPLPPEIREELKTKAPSVWDWVGNPADVSILGGAGITGVDMLRMMASNDNFDLLLACMPEVPLANKDQTLLRIKNEMMSYITVKKAYSKPLLAVLGEKSLGIDDYGHWRWRLAGEMRTELIKAGIPVFPTMKQAARAVIKLIGYYARK